MPNFINKPVTNVSQAFSSAEKKQARDNIDVYSKSEVDDIASSCGGYVVVQKLPSVEEANKNKVYLVGPQGSGTDKYEEWVITDDGIAEVWTLIGETSIDLSPYDKIVDAEAREKVINDALTAHKNDSVAHITAAERTSWNGAVSNSHTHSNKAELDKIASGDKAKWDAKQDAISDLATIRSGAAAGATAVQPSSLAKVATSGSYNDLSNKPTIPAAITIDSAMSSTSTNPVQNKVVKDALDGKVDSVSGGYRTINQDVSKGANLVVNGNGIIGTNYNFSSCVFDGVDTVDGSSGAFVTSSNMPIQNEKIKVDVQKKYLSSVYAKSDTGAGILRMTMYCLDVDGKNICAYHTMYGVGTTTKLARDLKKGDTKIYLESVSGWNVGIYNGYQRGFIFWNYKNTRGYTYPKESYSRNITWDYRKTYFDGNGGDSTYCWYDNASAIDFNENSISLKSSWQMADIPAGTWVSKCDSGGNYKYLATGGVDNSKALPSSWDKYTGYIGGIDYSGRNITNKFYPGTAFAKMGFVNANFSASNKLHFTNYSLYEVQDEATNVTGIVAIANGGTGASTAAQARTNLGLGSLATKSSVADADISGTISDTHIASASKWNAKQDAIAAMTADFVNGEWDK